MLDSMTVRHGDWPVDLDPPFKDELFTYEAKLDYSMDYFAVDVRPRSGCEIDQMPPKKTFVQIGGSVPVRVSVKNAEDPSKKTTYTVIAKRLLGSETELQFLAVGDDEDPGELMPIWNPFVRTYHVRLPLQHDVAKVVYRLRDNEQRIRSTAHLEEQTGSSGAAQSSKSDSHAEGRLLRVNSTREGVAGNESYTRWLAKVRKLSATVKEPLHTTGEVQYRDASQNFMLDVGYSRKIVIAVQCADATQANIGAYTLQIHRPGCSPERPYFDPEKKVCVNFCPSGFYRNEEIHRCSKCNTYCKVCDSLLHCQMCLPDTADYTYMVQPDGRCQRTVNHLFRKYRWWCIGLGVLLCFLVCIGCIGICQLLGTCGHGIQKKSHKVHTYDSDSGGEDGPPYGARRRLAQY